MPVFPDVAVSDASQVKGLCTAYDFKSLIRKSLAKFECGRVVSDLKELYNLMHVVVMVYS